MLGDFVVLAWSTLLASQRAVRCRRYCTMRISVTLPANVLWDCRRSLYYAQPGGAWTCSPTAVRNEPLAVQQVQVNLLSVSATSRSQSGPLACVWD